MLDAFSKTGDVTLGAAGSIYNGGNLSDPTDLDSAVLSTHLGANVYGNSITLNAGLVRLGGIGSAATGFNIVSSFSAGADQGVVTLTAGDQNIYLYEAATTLATTSNGDIVLYAVSAGADATAFITTPIGSILNGRSDNDAIVIAGKADLIAQDNVGVSADRANGFTGRIVSTVGNVEAIATSGSIWLWNIGALIVGGVVPAAESPFSMYAPNGHINIETSSPLEISQSLQAYGAIVKQAGNSTDNVADILNSNLTIDPGVTVQSTHGSITLDAGNDVTIDGASIVNGVVMAAGAQLLAATTIAIDAGYLDNSTRASGSPTANVTIGSGALVSAGTTLTVNAENNITIAGADPSGLAGPATLTAGASILLRSGYLVAEPGYDGLASTIVADGAFSAPTLTLDAGGAGSDIEFSPSTLDANTFINAGGGDNFVHLYNLPSLTSYATYVDDDGRFAHAISVDGLGGGDTFEIDATAATDYVVNIVDSGPLDSGLNTLIINGATTTSGQTFLLRDNFVAILESNGSPVYQRINYDDSITNQLEINGGDVTGAVNNPDGTPTSNGNSFFIDGNSALTTINAGDGNDIFQVGQLYSDDSIGSASGDVGAVAGDGLEWTQTTLGELSYGVEMATVLYGGAGTDTFQVYSNKADLSMIGGSGNDMFIVRAFLVAAGTHLSVKGGTGDDTIEYNINAPLDIEGGTGFNTLVLLGTEGPDTFVVTQDGVFGGGLDVSYSNIQAVTIDTLEGDDTIYVESTPVNVVTTINGGAGDDKIIVGGDITQQVVANSTQGASSVTDNAVTSADPAYNGVFVAGIPVTVAGAGAAIISQPPQSVVHAGDATSITSFTVSAPSALAAGNTAYVDISPAQPSAEWAALGAAALQVSIDGGVTWSATAQLKFVGGQTGPQTVLLRAAPSTAGDSYARDESIIVAARVVSNDQPELDSLELPTVKVTVKSSASGLIIDQGVAPTTILGGATQTSYAYSLSLNQALTGNQTVTVDIADANAAADGVSLTQNGQVVSSVTFNASNWNVAQQITVTSNLSGLHEEVPVDITQSINGADVGDVNLTIASTETPGVLLLTPQGSAEVSPTQTYTYQMVLTQAPTAPVTVSVLGDGQTIASSAAAGFDAANQTVTFTAANWNVPVTITLALNPNYTPPASTGQSAGATYMTFPNQPHTLAQINGPLIVDGATEAGQPSLVAAFGLPYETNNIPVTEAGTGTGQGQGVGADILQVYADGSSANLTGSLTTISSGDLFAGTGDNISGLGIPDTKTLTFTNPVTNVKTQFEGGIDFVNLDAVQVFLGPGDDTFTIDTTAPTINATDGRHTLMAIEGGGGSNTIDVTASSDPLVLYGSDSGSGVEYNSTPGAITGNAYSFANFGSDTIDASGATGTVVIVGGPMSDKLTGGSGVTWIFGGGGDDTITAAGPSNYIFGDSSATVGALVAAPSQPADDPDAQTLDLASRLLTIDNANPTRNDDTITVTGAGSSVVIGDYGVIDIVGQAAGVVDPFGSLGAEVITTVMSVDTSVGGDNTINVGDNDVIIGGAGDDHIVVGAVGADVIIGDNGEVDYVNGVLTSAESIDPLHGGADVISGPLVNGQATPAGSGGSVIIGGVGADSISIGGADNVVVGDDGRALFTTAGVLSSVTTLDPSYGGANVITISGGHDTVLGGYGSDQITIGGGDDVVVGDNGYASFTASGALAFITTTDQSFGGNNAILVNGGGGNTIFGGSGADTIMVNGAGGNVVFGDNGEAYFTNGVLTQIETIGEVAAASGATASVESTTSGVVYGGDDTIKVGSGDNVIVGGLGADSISTGAGDNIVLGDSGAATFDASGVLVSISSTFAAAPVGGTPDTGSSSNDAITLGSGNNVVIGGVGADQIVVGAVGANVIIGDDGEAQFVNGVLTSIASTDGALGYGGDDTISGPMVNGQLTYGGSGGNVVIGGLGADTILLGGAGNTILGDDGKATFTSAGVLATITTTDPGSAATTSSPCRAATTR